jgi:phosphate transport system substrate-binding protein
MHKFTKEKHMKKILALLAATLYLLSPSANAQNTITGAGATFPFPIYSKWAEIYSEKHDVQLNYQSIGSSGGLRQIKAKTVIFGASDAPMSGADLEKEGLVQFPAIIVYLGDIAKWNDAKILALNPGKALPDQAITVVHRADGSGTTFNWTDYLSTASPAWLERVGKGAAVKWPAPSSVGGKGNEGVAANVARIKGSIGYVEYAYVKKNKLVFMQMQNRNGRWVSPDDTTFAAAAAGADWFSVPGMGLSIVDQKGDTVWPVTTASFILMYKDPAPTVVKVPKH